LKLAYVPFGTFVCSQCSGTTPTIGTLKDAWANEKLSRIAGATKKSFRESPPHAQFVRLKELR
jgi:hypothetical protein